VSLFRIVLNAEPLSYGHLNFLSRQYYLSLKFKEPFGFAYIWKGVRVLILLSYSKSDMKFRLAAIFVMSCTIAFGQNYQLHSVFIYSFTKYIQWPADYNQGDFEINVLGDSPMLAELKKLSELKKVGNRTIKVTNLNSVADLRKCNILFVPAAKSNQLGEVLAKLGSNATLVITEQAGLGAKGSAINFITKDGKVAFELNQGALTKHGLKASIELIRLAILI
jgi:hypothetical protein